MATSIARSGVRAAFSLRRGPNPLRANKKSFSASAHHDDAYETAKWEKITYAGIVTCTILAAYNLSKGHPHHDDPPPYPYLHIRNKEFPWALEVSLSEEKVRRVRVMPRPKARTKRLIPTEGFFVEEAARTRAGPKRACTGDGEEDMPIVMLP